MALEDIQKAVLDTARKEAARIVEAARQAADAKVAAETEALRREAERRYAAETRAIEEDYARKLVQHKGAANKRLLELRNRRLREVFQRARRQVLDAPADEYRQTMARLLELAAEGAGGLLRVHPDDRAVFEEILASFNAGRPENEQVRLDDAQALPERGGFILVSEDFEVDQTLDTLLTDLEHDMSPAIAAALFGKQ